MVFIDTLTLKVTWVGSLLISLPIGVQSEKVPKKKKRRILNNIKELDPRTHFNKCFGLHVCMFVCMCV